MKKYFLFYFTFCLLLCGCDKIPEHPRIYISEKQKDVFIDKLESAAWAKNSFEKMKEEVTVYVNRHMEDPEWIISRMQMYWDNRYERIYVKGNFYSHGTGEAPVPTVKFAGARDWETDYAMPSLEDTQPYMDEKGMYVQNMKKEGHPWEWVHPSKTGRMIAPMNERIMTLAAKAAFLYWLEGDEKYAVFAHDIFTTYVKGIYHRREPFALENYTNSHLMGLVTFEVILDRIVPDMVVCYDFLYHYLKRKGEDMQMISEVFKRFADQQILYGVPDNNWNIFQARHVTYLALALEDDSYYEDKKGRQYYIDQIFNHTTIRQFALKEAIIDIFDPETGMWPESASYSMSVCKDMLDILCLIDNAENNRILEDFPILKKAVPATVEYLFPNGNVTAFGDASYSPLNTNQFELLISLYRKYGEQEEERKLTEVLQQMINDGLYKRETGSSMFSLFFYVDRLLPISNEEAGYDRLTSNMFYAPNVSWLMQRNGKDSRDGMALTLTGSYGNHAHANGISLELFGKGLMLAPESSYGVSYGSRDNQEYFARFPAHNTVIVDGISDYGMMRSNHPYQLLSCYPSHGDNNEIVGKATFARVGFVEPRTNADQERITGIIRNSPTSSYVIDIFRSARKDGNDKKHEYIYHSIGDQLTLTGKGGIRLALSPTNELSSSLGDLRGYDYYKDKKSVAYAGDMLSRFHITQKEGSNVFVDMWMKGYPERTLFSVLSPPSRAFNQRSVPPDFVEKNLPTLIVRQKGEAWNRPFVSVIHPYREEESSSIASVDYHQNGDLLSIDVRCTGGTTDYILNSISPEETKNYRGIELKGIFAIVSETGSETDFFFLGEGNYLKKGKWVIEDNMEGEVSMYKKGNKINIHLTGTATVTFPAEGIPQIKAEDNRTTLPEGIYKPEGTFTITLSAGRYGIELK